MLHLSLFASRVRRYNYLTIRHYFPAVPAVDWSVILEGSDRPSTNFKRSAPGKVMSEYIEIESEPTETPNVVVIRTNLELAVGDPEYYESTPAMAEGSAVAQTLATIEGLITLRIEAHDLVVEHDYDVPWHIVEAEIAAALKDFFL